MVLPNLQVISQFVIVVSNTNDALSAGTAAAYPPSAAQFAAGLALSNLDLTVFIPTGCIFPTASFYDLLLFKSLVPLGAISLFWAFPMFLRVAGKRQKKKELDAACLSLFLLELLVSGVSTTIVSTFACERIDGELFLLAELTQRCDGSTARKLYLSWAWIATVVYPIGAF